MVSVPKKLIRLLGVSLAASVIVLLFVNLEVSQNAQKTIQRYNQDASAKLVSQPMSWQTIQDLLTFKKTSELSRDEIVEHNYKKLQKILSIPITEPKDGVLARASDSEYRRANATLTVLVRNRELNQVVHTIKQMEKNFNRKYHYPYVFLNDAPFTDRFKKQVLSIVSGEAYFETIDKEIWQQPESIDKKKQQDGVKHLASENIGYAKMISYHNMCRYYSVNFFNHPRLKQFKYYWRFEPGTDYFCDLDYDVFRYMEDRELVYGFVIALYDAQQSVETLWPTTLEFLQQNPQYLNPNGAFGFLTENLQNPEKTLGANGYSTCHFWSNFEIADMDFYRSEAYSSWAKWLDENGGFYYERWGDAPVHSVGVSLFADKRKVHWFRDIGYKHQPYTLCSNCESCSGCEVADFTYKHLWDQNCLTNWWDYEMDEEARNLY